MEGCGRGSCRAELPSGPDKRREWGLAGKNVFDQNRALSFADAGHFFHYFSGMLHVMQGKAGDDHVKFLSLEREMLGVAGTKGDVGDAALGGAFPRDGKHGFGEVHADDFAGIFGEGFSDVAGAGGDIQHALGASKARCSDEAVDALLVGNPRIGGKGPSLGGERLSNNFVVSAGHGGHDWDVSRRRSVRNRGRYPPYVFAGKSAYFAENIGHKKMRDAKNRRFEAKNGHDSCAISRKSWQFAAKTRDARDVWVERVHNLLNLRAFGQVVLCRTIVNLTQSVASA
jgi:hypothetical protein